MTEDHEWKSGVLRCFDCGATTCKPCLFIGGSRDTEIMLHVIMLLDSKLAESEHAERAITRRLGEIIAAQE